MKFLNFLWKDKRRTKSRRKTARKTSGTAILKNDIETIKNQFSAFNLILSRHQNQLDDQSLLIEKHSQKLDSLENIIARQPTKPALTGLSQPDRPVESTGPDRLDVQSGKFDISMFSPQEKRILSVFFENPDLSLCYADIGSSLAKSANTIKNQMHQINIKADLFNSSVDNQSRKRFKLKDNIRLEKYLRVK